MDTLDWTTDGELLLGADGRFLRSSRRVDLRGGLVTGIVPLKQEGSWLAEGDVITLRGDGAKKAEVLTVRERDGETVLMQGEHPRYWQRSEGVPTQAVIMGVEGTYQISANVASKEGSWAAAKVGSRVIRVTGGTLTLSAGSTFALQLDVHEFDDNGHAEERAGLEIVGTWTLTPTREVELLSERLDDRVAFPRVLRQEGTMLRGADGFLFRKRPG